MKSLKDILNNPVNEERIEWLRYASDPRMQDKYDVPDDIMNLLNQLNDKHNYGNTKAIVDKDCTGRPIRIGDIVLATEIPAGERGKEKRNYFWLVVGKNRAGAELYNPKFHMGPEHLATCMKGPDLLVIRDPQQYLI